MARKWAQTDVAAGMRGGTAGMIGRFCKGDAATEAKGISAVLFACEARPMAARLCGCLPSLSVVSASIIAHIGRIAGYLS